MINQKIQQVLNLIEIEKTEEAKNIFAQITPEETSEYWLCNGILEQKYQNWGAAINAFNKVLEIDPENNDAQNNLHIIQNILNFWNPEMFNP